ncbi:PAPA-1-like domain-containing protein [Sporobolomyces koalae]|uniref:PAPA-1-like domain-containing protein n=1 Tax=Sporobolomyces koalae TaxID=500713 RepID=UPI003173AB09
MPPRIRSPTPSEEEEDQLMDSPPPPSLAPPQSLPSLPALKAGSGTTIRIKPPLPPPPAPYQPAAPTSELSDASTRTASRSKRPARTKKPTKYDDYSDDEQDEEEQDELEDEEDELADDVDDDEGDYAPAGRGNSSRKPAPAPTRKSGRKSGPSAKTQSRRASGAAAASASAAEPSGIKIKFKLGTSGTAGSNSGENPPSAPASVASTSGSRGRGKAAAGGARAAKASTGRGKGKGKKKADSEEDDDDELSFGSDDDELPESYLDQDEEDGEGAEIDQLDDQLDGYSSTGSAGPGSDGASSSAAGSSIYGGRKTARQRAKEMGGDEALELMSLPHRTYSKPAPPVLTAEEVALQKAEKSRKRKHQADKKLEDEKTETINRLLKKQVGKAPSTTAASTAKKAGKSKLSKSITADAGSGDEEDERPVVEEPVKVFIKPTVARWISSIKDGEFRYSYSVPEGREIRSTRAAQAAAPEPKLSREPPRKRIFSEEERAEQKRLNRIGWEKVMLGVA